MVNYKKKYLKYKKKYLMTKNLYGGSPTDTTKVKVYFKIESKSPKEDQEYQEDQDEWEEEGDILGSPDTTIELLIPTSETYTNFVENLLKSIEQADLKKLTDSTTITNLKYIIKQTNNYKLYIKSIKLGDQFINEESYKKYIDISDDSILFVTFSTQREDRIIFEDRMIGYKSKNNKSIMNTILKNMPECEDKIFRYYVMPPWYPKFPSYYIEYKGTNVKMFDYNTFSITLTPLGMSVAKDWTDRERKTYAKILNLKFRKVEDSEVLFEEVGGGPRAPRDLGGDLFGYSGGWEDFKRYYLLMAVDVKFEKNLNPKWVEKCDALMVDNYRYSAGSYPSDWISEEEAGCRGGWYNEYVQQKYLLELRKYLELSEDPCWGWVM